MKPVLRPYTLPPLFPFGPGMVLLNIAVLTIAIVYCAMRAVHGQAGLSLTLSGIVLSLAYCGIFANDVLHTRPVTGRLWAARVLGFAQWPLLLTIYIGSLPASGYALAAYALINAVAMVVIGAWAWPRLFLRCPSCGQDDWCPDPWHNGRPVPERTTGR